jgi:arylsulfatase A-like enzyme
MPFFAPQKYFRPYPPGQTVMPSVNKGDRGDLPPGAISLLRPKNWFFEGLMKAESVDMGTWQEAVRAYQACASFADAQIGRLLDAVDECEVSKDTVIVLWSDHGYHLGEKQHWEKFALWEKTTHVPYIIVAPGVGHPGQRCDRPVDLMTVYPTLLELCGLPQSDAVDGVSLLPLLKNPDTMWDRPAIMTYQSGNHAVRTQRWRYIRYADGSDELYDHSTDRHEWDNLAHRSDLRETIRSLSKWFPKQEAAAVSEMRRPVAKPVP